MTDGGEATTTRAGARREGPSFGRAFLFWLKLGFISFGGPTGQIAIMQKELVDGKRWVSQGRFLHALNYCMMLPGPEATQLAIYVGWLLHRTAGGLVAGALFVIPSIFILLTLSYVYVAYGAVTWVAAIFDGLKAAVVAIVADATLNIGRRALRHPAMYAVAGAAFVALFVFHAPFPLIVMGAAALGIVGVRRWPAVFAVAGPAHASDATVIADDDPAPEHTRPSLRRALGVTAVALAFWLVPLGALALWRGGADVLVREAVFFSKAAMVTFGGAYAVLPYVAQEAVETLHWLSRPEMIDGLGLAETTPGPLIMVLQFVGFMAGFHHARDLGLLGAVLGGLVATYFTFMPCFFWIFLGAPYVEQGRGNRVVAGALGTVTAAVVGVVLNLAVWFGLSVLFPRRAVNVFGLVVALLAFAVLRRFKVGVIPVVLGAAVAGIGYRVLTSGW